MNTLWVTLIAIFGCTLALPVNYDQEALLELLSRTDLNGRNSALENAIISALEGFRETMLTGSEGLPVMEPFKLDHALVDDSVIPVPGARIEINDLTASHLSTFELNSVSVTRTSLLLQRYDVVVDGEVPSVEVDVGDYDLSLNVAGLSLFGNGDGKIIIFKPRIKVELLVGLRPRLGIYLNVLSTRIEVGITDIQIELRGMFNNPDVDGFINLFLKNFLLEFLSSFSEEITDTISPLVQDFANEILDDINLIDILG